MGSMFAATFIRAALLMSVLALPCSYFSPSIKVVSAQLDIVVWTPQEGKGMPDGTTVISQLATALLGSGTPGMLWGTVGADDVSSICSQVTDYGQYGFSASVEYGGDTLTRNMQIIALGGCGAAGYGAVDGLQALLQDDDGRTSALVCPQEQASVYGCDLYDTGDDLTTLYYGGSQASTTSNTTAAGLGHRRLLDNCFTEGTAQGAKWGAVAGIAVGIVFCDGGIDIVCDIAIAAACAGAGAGLGVGYTCAGSAGKNSNSGCFPGSAMVTLASGASAPMSSLSLGDQVAVRSPNGAISYSSIYAFGHALPHKTFPFVQITLGTHFDFYDHELGAQTSQSLLSMRRVIRLTADHFLPTYTSAKDATLYIVYKRAKDINVGDILLAISDEDSAIKSSSATTKFVVTDVRRVFESGLYNPFTLEGDIIVDGVVASTHSGWFLDNMFESFGLSRFLPKAYQAILFPIRMAYYVIGQGPYNRLYSTLDSQIGIELMGNIYLGQLALLIAFVVMFIFDIIAKKDPSNSGKKASMT